MALGAMPDDDPLFMGMLGMHGRKGTNILLHEADFVLAIGARFDDRATGKAAEFCPNAKIAHIDIDRAEIGKIKSTTLGITGDAREILRRLLEVMDATLHSTTADDRPFVVPPSGGRFRVNAEQRTGWLRRAHQLRAAYPLHRPPRDEQPLHPLNIIAAIAEALPHDAIITTDVGQHQMWVAQAYPFHQPRTLLTSGGLGTMGFGLPAAIGAALAMPGRRVVCVSGDGSILMNVQELATLAELQLPVAIVLMNNDHLGLVRQQQELFYRERYSASRFHTAPDFAAVAQAFGIRGVRLDPANDPLAQLTAALRQPGPILIDVPIESATNVYPMVPPGAANVETITAPELQLADSHA
jgi:acetolactate synthase-1/2/3 large subunit